MDDLRVLAATRLEAHGQRLFAAWRLAACIDDQCRIEAEIQELQRLRASLLNYRPERLQLLCDVYAEE